MEEIKDNCIKKGWYDKPVEFPAAIALLHSEVSEAFEAYRERGFENWYVTTLANNREHAHAKPMGVASEFADIFIRLLDYCSRFDIDLIEATEAKMAYNTSRPYRHGGKTL